MGPAIDRIVSENVRTMDASQEMLALLAQPDLPGRVESFAAALASVDAEAEPLGPLVQRIEARYPLALAPEAGSSARTELLELVRELFRVNRAAMEAADGEAMRLGSAGAWSVVVLGLLILAASQGFAARLGRRLVQPLLAVEKAAREAREGDPYRRCPVDPGAAEEIRALAGGINALLDAKPPSFD